MKSASRDYFREKSLNKGLESYPADRESEYCVVVWPSGPRR